MNLKKQLFTAFLAVAILPLIIISIYLFGTNIGLAFELYRQDLYNSTEIQADLVDENINRMMVRAGRFAETQAVRSACAGGEGPAMTKDSKLAGEIQTFMDETLDSIAIFGLVTAEGELLYSSGSNSDTGFLKAAIETMEQPQTQTVFEIAMEDPGVNSLALYTPVQTGSGSNGGFVAVFKTDYFLKMISSHKQMESSNAFIYCRQHGRVVVSKQEFTENFGAQTAKLEEKEGSLFCEIGGVQSLVHFRRVTKTPWVLVSSIPVGQILSQVFDYGLVSVLVVLLFVVVILLLSRRESKKILQPLEALLGAVEQFFLSGGEFPVGGMNPRTEIGYLAARFAKLSDEISAAQRKLKESNYLYNTLLEATYEQRLTVDLGKDRVLCSETALEERLQQPQNLSAPERVLRFLEENDREEDPGEQARLREIVTGKRPKPGEAEVCCCFGTEQKEGWYRMISVPISGEDGEVRQVVLHFEDITQKKLEEFRLIRSSQADPLCGLLNQQAFLTKCRLLGQREGAVFFIDLDQFKQVNDTLGHAAGDEVLVAAAQAIRAQFRTTDTLGRYGGDEFVAFAPGLTSEQAETKAKLLVETMRFERRKPQGDTVLVTASVGVTLTGGQADLKEAVHLADGAMYRAKQNGKARYFMLPGFPGAGTPQ